MSVLIPILNEARVIRDTLPPMLDQPYDGELEFLLLDGGSDDGTLEILAELAAGDSRIRVLDNPGRRQSAALNIGLAEAKGKYICRMDAHSHYPRDYVRVGAERLCRGDVTWVAGPAIAVGFDPWSDRIALALTSPLGVGGARFRLALEEEAEVDTGFTGILTAETLRQVGGWSEDWGINEDGELAARVLAAGGTIVCVPEMAAEFIPRNSLGELSRQYWRYGLGRAKTWLRHPGSLRRSHVLPPGLVLTTLGAIAGPRPLRGVCRAGLSVYGSALLIESLRQARKASASDAAWLPLVFMTMHFSWGSGFMVGMINGRRDSRAA